MRLMQNFPTTSREGSRSASATHVEHCVLEQTKSEVWLAAAATGQHIDTEVR